MSGWRLAAGGWRLAAGRAGCGAHGRRWTAYAREAGPHATAGRAACDAGPGRAGGGAYGLPGRASRI